MQVPDNRGSSCRAAAISDRIGRNRREFW
jgi:hypothetical protein